MTPNEAADVVQKNWQNFSAQVDRLLIDLGDKICGILIPDDEMVLLIQRLSEYTDKPVFYNAQPEEDDFTRAVRIGHNTHIDRKWISWARQMQNLHAEIIRIIQRYKLPQDYQRWNLLNAYGVDSIDFSQFKIGPPRLDPNDLRAVFRKMLDEKDQTPVPEFDVEKMIPDIMRNLRAQGEGKKLTKEEAEEVIAQMSVLDISNA